MLVANLIALAAFLKMEFEPEVEDNRRNFFYAYTLMLITGFFFVIIAIYERSTDEAVAHLCEEM